MNIMVTGAAGGYGSKAVKYVKQFAPSANVFGLVRKEADAAKLEAEGIRPRIADYGNIDSLVKAFEGIDRLLFVSVPVHELQINVVKAAKASNIKFIAYTSIADPQYSKFGLEINHRQTEELIRQSGIGHVFLRDNWYLEIVQEYLKTAVRTGNYAYFAGDNKISFALKREYAEAGARVITGSGYPEILTLAGTPVTFKELAEVAEKVSGKKLNIKRISQDDFAKEYAGSGISEFGFNLAMYYQAYTLAGNNGEEKLTTDDLEKALGHKVNPLADAIKELL